MIRRPPRSTLFPYTTALPISRQIRANTISFTVFPEIVPSIGNSLINTMKNINHTRSSISDDIRNILDSSANMRRAIPLILRLLMNEVNLSTNLASHFFDLVIGKILTSRLSLSKHLAHFFFNDTATTEIYTLSLHDALPIFHTVPQPAGRTGLSQAVEMVFLADRACGTCNLRGRSEEHTSELQSQSNLVCRLLLEKKNWKNTDHPFELE